MVPERDEADVDGTLDGVGVVASQRREVNLHDVAEVGIA